MLGEVSMKLAKHSMEFAMVVVDEVEGALAAHLVDGSGDMANRSPRLERFCQRRLQTRLVVTIIPPREGDNLSTLRSLSMSLSSFNLAAYASAAVTVKNSTWRTGSERRDITIVNNRLFGRRLCIHWSRSRLRKRLGRCPRLVRELTPICSYHSRLAKRLFQFHRPCLHAPGRFAPSSP